MAASHVADATSPFRMPAPPPMPPRRPLRVVAKCAGYVMADDGARIVFATTGTSAGYTLRYVFGLLTLITSMNALVWIGKAISDGDARVALPALVFSAIALPFGLALALTVRWMRRAAAAPVESLPPLLVLDRSTGALADGHGRFLAHAHEVWFEARWQLASSARSLACVWRGGSVVVARGNHLFGGTIGSMRDAIRSRGLRA